MGRTDFNRRYTLMTAQPQTQSGAAELIRAAGRSPVSERRHAGWMPGFASQLSDKQIADMAACARSAWHSRARSAATIA